MLKIKNKVFKILASLLVGSMLPISSFAVDSTTSASSPSGISIELTQQEYDKLKEKGELPKDYPIIIKKDWTPPKGSKKLSTKEFLEKTSLGKNILKEYGEDLKKEKNIDKDVKVIETIEVDYWQYPEGFNPEDNRTSSILGKVDSFLSKSAAACAFSGHADLTKQTAYVVGTPGVVEARQYLSVHVDTYEQDFKTYVKHTNNTQAWWWRTSSEYTLKNAYFAFAIQAVDCWGYNLQKTIASSYFTPAWSSNINNSLTYSFTHSDNYTGWKAANDGDSLLTYHKIQSDLYHRTTQISTTKWSPTIYDDYGEGPF